MAPWYQAVDGRASCGHKRVCLLHYQSEGIMVVPFVLPFTYGLELIFNLQSLQMH
jgi:hypothetical protein